MNSRNSYILTMICVPLLVDWDILAVRSLILRFLKGAKYYRRIVNDRFFLCVKREWEFIFSVIGESIIFRLREIGFRFFLDQWKMHLLTRDLWTIDFSGNNCSLFGDFSVTKARKLHQTGCKKRDGMPFSTSLDARDDWRTEN